MTSLDPRKQAILQAVIVEYVGGALPVASELIVGKYELGVKSATVRNELADLATLGYLEQPHTSAGRIPSDAGYRYYVDHLIVPRPVPEPAKLRVRSATERGEVLQSVLRDTMGALGRLTQMLAVAATFRESSATVRSALVSALGPERLMLMLVLSNGHVVNRLIEGPAGLTLEDVGQVNDLLASAAVGKPIRQAARGKAPSAGSAAPDKLLATIWANLRTVGQELTQGLLILEGQEFLYAQPEFQRNLNLLGEMLESLSGTDVLYDALGSPTETQTVTIGRENRSEKLHPFTLVRRSFFVGTSEAGVIALVGPTRMRYETSIPLVTFTAQALSDSLTRSFG
ncbi:MAG: heat-inducible transcription repressor HrcA [Fimbriimonas ginsengisoli]|uniref:Heat-inducible transcription repressor HrcA n=1 Tax=Fimbriimonas ginsengisoli TaxID=1005039 RepID=A0A931LWE4_FIMGI|nr:heat-inducible transcription repressor HrcA [Fimbriimonas ginsengisoli]